MQNRLALIFLSALVTLSLGHDQTALAKTPMAGLPVITLKAGNQSVRAEVAATDEARQKGLMFREKMAQNEGMVFVFEGPAQVCMWMKNTLLPLAVAFIDGNGKIINIEEMQPQTLDSHCAKSMVRYALEMNGGWFKQKNIKPGTVIGGLPSVR